MTEPTPGELILVRPAVEYRVSYLAALREHQAQGRFLDSRHRQNDPLSMEHDFANFVETLAQADDPTRVPPGGVRETFYWLLEAGGLVVVGRSSIRHALSEEPLLRDIGHIGYDIRPSRQGLGYGNAVLGLTLARARAFGMTRVLLTCNSDNVPSKRIIERWGGAFERAVPLTGRDRFRLRYWIDLR